ncbi:transporter substrate-binding domain-containing protein [Vogesella sp. DC21W]|uniref:Transporter substrate-binding domain-containing protein n=1 Tax=Vogesella aquatica TaxID=2984206 RepID=A0ABT5J0M0_9NEIS|nr:transporter substrate-binding domain-containing protein [Vogesella aquatica]MDC7718375.1 transporter substrate-binding domain-containing protein [Vogesella aquatica]
MKTIFAAMFGGSLWLSAGGAAANPVVSVCAEPWAPFIDSAPDQPAIGLAADVINRVAEANKLRVKYIFKSAGACLRLARQGQVDMLAFAGAADSPAGWVQTRQPLVYWVLGAWVATGSPQQAFTGLEAFSQQRVGWVSAYDYPVALKRKQDWQRVDVIDTARGMRMLLGGRVDVVFDDGLAGSNLPPAMRDKVRLLKPLVGSVSQPISLRPGLFALREGIDAEAELLRKNGQLDDFYQHYFDNSIHQVLHSLH